MKQNNKILIVIPAYNEEENIEKVLNEIKMDIDYADILVIDDCSKDNTRKIVEKNNVKCITNVINMRYAWAVQTGLKYAYQNNYDYVIQMDADGQHIAKEAEKLYKEIIKTKADIVIGSRYVKELSEFKSSRVRQMGIKFLSSLIKIVTGKKIYDVTSGYRACDKELIKLFANNYPTDYPEPDSTTKVLKLGYKVSEIPVEMNEREKGKSSIGFIDSIYYMIKVSLCILMQSKN